MAEQSPSLEELNAKLAAPQPLYAIIMEPTERFQPPTSAEGHDLLRRHLMYLVGLQEAGTLYGGGLLDADLAPGQGLLLVRADSRAAAEAIAADEPYQAAGWRTNRVRAWQARIAR